MSIEKNQIRLISSELVALAVGLSMAVAACTVGQPGAPANSAAAASPASPAPAPAPENPSKHDSVSSQDDDLHASVGKTAPVGCEKEIALECNNGFVDGCTVKHPSGQSKLLTSHHVCVARADTKGGPSCAQEIARECPEGQVDACLATPRMSDVHVCVTTQ